MGSDVPSLRLTSNTATSGVLCSNHRMASAQDRKGPATENPASSRNASRDMPISAWSSTIMQQGRVISPRLGMQIRKARLNRPIRPLQGGGGSRAAEVQMQLCVKLT